MSSLQTAYPFRRVSVDHMIRGMTRVWWQLDPRFRDPGPYIFQLQVGWTGLNDADDWQDVGQPVANAFYAVDIKRAATGYVVTPHYRVALTTPLGNYLSTPAPCFGELDESDWLRAREIIRKEILRHKKIAIQGYLLKALRHGAPCPRCIDKLTVEVSDTDCPVCYGTSFEGGYHPPLPLQCWDLTPQTIAEDRNTDLKGTTRDKAYVRARVIGFPDLHYLDVWVNATSDERWRIDEIQIAAALRGVPLVYNVSMGLLPISNISYGIPITPADEPPSVTLPIIGTGCVIIGTYYGGMDLRYLSATNTPIAGARMYVFTKAEFDANYPTYPARHRAVAGTTTNTVGAWNDSLLLDPGNYVLLYEKHNEFGPDTRALTVVHPASAPQTSSSSSSASSSTVGGSGHMPHPGVTGTKRVVDNFWEI
jgi:hypothetical protein